MKLIIADKFLQDMADLYRQAGWDEREVHFSLADLRSNIGMEDTIPIPVIRCKDCKYYEEQDETIGTCLLTESGAHVKGYCSWAERKGHDNT